MSQDDPIYNIGVVARMTDIPAATLRVWERRYGFPDTARTEGGHRLYSDSDVQRLRWVKTRIDAGMQTRQAVRALKALEMQDQGPGLHFDGGDATPLSGFRAEGGAAGVDSYIELLQNRLVSALLGHDLAYADDLLSESLGLYTPEDVMLHLIRPALVEIGDGWLRGDVSIGTEHYATSYLRQRLIHWLRSGPPLYQVPPTVLACAPGEYHEGSLMIFGALLRRRRWPLAYLGQSIPLADLAQFVQRTSPLAVVVVAMTDEPAAALADWPKHLPDAARDGQPVFAYGGRAFSEKPEWRARVPGLFLGTEVLEGVDTLEGILRRLSSERR
jgi:MerR family transcriptional regulator, light-induced transcriptional regulator